MAVARPGQSGPRGKVQSHLFVRHDGAGDDDVVVVAVARERSHPKIESLNH